MDDIELLQTFAERGSEDAFRTLVDRHINLVYSVARQTVRDPQLAEEIVQTVFIILAQKATRLGKVKALSGWLYRTTRLAAIQAVRNECRRREREEKFAQMDHTPSESVWEQVEPHLGEVMDRLSELDRNILALRFFESKSFKELALVLGKGEDAARMRVNRAIEKLRKLLLKRGVTVSASALLASIAANSAQAAPEGLAANAATAALAQTSVVTSSALVKGTLKVMAWTKIKTAALSSAALLLFGGMTAVFIHQSSAVRSPAPLSADQKAVLLAAESLVNSLSRGDGEAFVAGLFTPDDSERRLAASIGEVARGIGAFDAALRKQFGDIDEVRQIRYTLSLMSGIPLLGYENHRTEIMVSGDEAFFRCLALWPSHDQMPLHFVRMNGEWKLLIDIGPRRAGWLEQAITQHQRGAHRYEQFAGDILAGRYKSPQEAWQAWSGSNELPRPAAVGKK